MVWFFLTIGAVIAVSGAYIRWRYASVEGRRRMLGDQSASLALSALGLAGVGGASLYWVMSSWHAEGPTAPYKILAMLTLGLLLVAAAAVALIGLVLGIMAIVASGRQGRRVTRAARLGVILNLAIVVALSMAYAIFALSRI
jgi:hypothetical protein